MNLKPLLPIFALLVFLPSCGSSTNTTVIIPGTMTLVSEPLPVAALKNGILADAEEVEIETELTVETEETDETVQLKPIELKGEGELPTDGPVKVKLNPEGDSSGQVFKLDENDQPLGPHQIQLDIVVEVNGQALEFNDVQVGGFTEAIDLEVEVPPIEYRNGNEDTHLMKMPGLKKFINIVFKRASEAVLFPFQDPAEGEMNSEDYPGN